MRALQDWGLVVLAASALLLIGTAEGACIRPKSDPNAPPQLDGPGSFGKLQDTVTLDCLTYVGSLAKDGNEHVLIRDEENVVYVLSVGDFMGENTGRITSIDEDFVYVEQRARQANGEIRAMIVRFPKKPLSK